MRNRWSRGPRGCRRAGARLCVVRVPYRAVAFGRHMARPTRARPPGLRPGIPHRVCGNDAARRCRRHRGSYHCSEPKAAGRSSSCRAASGRSCCCRSLPRCWRSSSGSTSPGWCSPPTRARRRCGDRRWRSRRVRRRTCERQFRTIGVIVIPVAVVVFVTSTAIDRARRQLGADVRPVRPVPHAGVRRSAVRPPGPPATSA